jgi:WD40 repeat protein
MIEAVKLWKLEGTVVKEAQTFRGHKDSLYAVAVSPDNRFLATGGYDQLIILWDLATGKPVREPVEDRLVPGVHAQRDLWLAAVSPEVAFPDQQAEQEADG